MGKFITPRELKEQLENRAEGLPPCDFIRKPGSQVLKDTWCAAHFGIGYERHVYPCELWVNPEQNSDTDFVLKTEHGEFPFQTTLADVPERRMTDDYKPGPDGEFPVRNYEPGRGTLEGIDWISDAVQKKVAVNYSTAHELNLLIYANFPTNGLDYQSLCMKLHKYSGQFASIWVVTNHQICSVMSFLTLGEISEFRLIYDSQEQDALVGLR
jgi:hypothetical protein